MTESNQAQRTTRLKRFTSCILATLLTIALLFSLTIQTAYATPTSAEKQAEADQASVALAAAETEMLQLRDDYRLAVEAHDAAIAGMEEAQGRIAAAQLVIDDTQDRLGTRANQMYRQGPLSFLDVLFGANSFEEFTTSWDLINAINQENAELIQTNKDARSEAEAAHEEYSSQEKVAAERETEAEAVHARAEELVVAQQAILNGLEAEVAELVAAEQAARLAAEAASAEQQYTGNNNGGGGGGGYTGAPIPSDGYGDVVAAAASRIGCPYVWAATGPDYFDCSGLTSWCYTQAGRGWIGRTDSAQYSSASARWAYTDGGAAPGDVLWWPGHVAIYAGGGSYIHAPLPGQSVCYSSWNINSATVLRF